MNKCRIKGDRRRTGRCSANSLSEQKECFFFRAGEPMCRFDNEGKCLSVIAKADATANDLRWGAGND